MVAGICGQVGAVFGINPRVVLPGCQSFVGVLVTSAIGGGGSPGCKQFFSNA